MSDFPIKPDFFKIFSLVERSQPSVGITDHGLNSAPVRLNQPERVWKIFPRPDGGVDISIRRLPYTGIDPDRGVVTVTIDPYETVQWYIIRSEIPDAYIITVDPEGTKGWTVDGVDDGIPTSPDSLIVIKPIVVLKSNPPKHLPFQLFKFEVVPEYKDGGE